MLIQNHKEYPVCFLLTTYLQSAVQLWCVSVYSIVVKDYLTQWLARVHQTLHHKEGTWWSSVNGSEQNVSKGTAHPSQQDEGWHVTSLYWVTIKWRKNYCMAALPCIACYSGSCCNTMFATISITHQTNTILYTQLASDVGNTSSSTVRYSNGANKDGKQCQNWCQQTALQQLLAWALIC